VDFLRSWQGRRVLVTGGPGFIGRHVILQGLRAGVEMHCLSSSRTLSGRVCSYQARLEDAEQVRKILQAVKPEGIIHLAAAGVSHGSMDLGGLLLSNALGTSNLLAAAECCGSVESIAIAGSGAEYAPRDGPIHEEDPVAPLSPYGVTKAAATFCASLYARRLPITVLRVFSVYGPGESAPRMVPYVIESARLGRPIELTACEQIRDYAYVEEVAESFWRVLSAGPHETTLRIMNVGSGKAIRLRELVTKLAALLRAEGFDPKIRFGAKPYRPDEPMVYLPDIARLKQVLAWHLRVGIDEGLKRTIDDRLGKDEIHAECAASTGSRAER
jgi:UDP-glucose 4-epimerase